MRAVSVAAVLSLFSSSLASIISSLTGSSQSVGSTASLTIANKVISPDGFSRSSVLANGEFPGPLITGYKGNQFLINVENELTDTSMLTSTSIHWHGFFQSGTNYADGVAFVSQCPITPKNSFLYDFSSTDQAGEYHSHLSTQYCDGLRGPLVVYDTNDPHKSLYDVDNAATVITLSDCFSAGTNATLQRLLISRATDGLGRYLSGPSSTLAVISVNKGVRYRFRLVAMSCAPNYQFSIDGHSLTIIEVDGVNHQALTVDSIQIFAGQRYSFVLQANQAVNNYWVRANPNIGNTGFTNGINSAILRYVGARSVDPTTTSSTSNPLVETSLRPLVKSAVPGHAYAGGADININLSIDLDYAIGKYLVNGVPFTPPSVPVLLQILSGAQAAQNLLPSGSVYALPPNKVVEVSIPGQSGGPHTFYVIRSAGSSTYNFDNPVIRDVVDTGLAGDNTTFRFVTDNAGPWFLHCHIDWHLDNGLAVVFAEDLPAVAVESTPSSWKALCPAYNKSLSS
ncbi:laccase 3 [Mycena maculata]|uniref:Laccase 3 n=1 Tax=Mycena maculata TaxID=230809 RepID=A0AAD7KKG5_9AGAR|nr:laccase 3 [Mycena maculata]